MGAGKAIQEVKYCRHFLIDLYEKIGRKDLSTSAAQPLPIYEDNRACIAMSESEGVTQRTKHVDVKYHYCRQQVTRGTVIFLPVKTQEQAADITTKSLSRVLHERHTVVLRGPTRFLVPNTITLCRRRTHTEEECQATVK